MHANDDFKEKEESTPKLEINADIPSVDPYGANVTKIKNELKPNRAQRRKFAATFKQKGNVSRNIVSEKTGLSPKETQIKKNRALNKANHKRKMLLKKKNKKVN